MAPTGISTFTPSALIFSAVFLQMIVVCCLPLAATVGAVHTRTHTSSPSSSPSGVRSTYSTSWSLSMSPTDDASTTLASFTTTSSSSLSDSDERSRTESVSFSPNASIGSKSMSSTSSRSPTIRSASASPTKETTKSPTGTSTETEEDSMSRSRGTDSEEITLSSSHASSTPTYSVTPSLSPSPSSTPSRTPSADDSFSSTPSQSAEVSVGTKTSTPSSTFTMSQERSKSRSSSSTPTSTYSQSRASASREATNSKTPSGSDTRDLSSSRTLSLDQNTNTVQKRTPSDSPSEFPTSTASKASNTIVPTITLNSLTMSTSQSDSQSSEVSYSGRSMTQTTSPTQTLSNDPSNSIDSPSLTLSPSNTREVTASFTQSPSTSDSKDPTESKSTSITYSVTLSDSPSKGTRSSTAPRSASPSKPSPTAEVSISGRSRTPLLSISFGSLTPTASLTQEISKSKSANTPSPTSSNSYNFRWLSMTVIPSASKLTATPSPSPTDSISIAVDGTTRSLTPSASPTSSISGEQPTASRSGTMTKSPTEEGTETKTSSLSRSVVSLSAEPSGSKTRRSKSPTPSTSLSQENSLTYSNNWTLSPSPLGKSRSETGSLSPTNTIMPTDSIDVLQTDSRSPTFPASLSKSESPLPSQTKTLSDTGLPSSSQSINVTDSGTPTATLTQQASGTWTPSSSPDQASVTGSRTFSSTPTPTPSPEVTLSASDSVSRNTPSDTPTPEDSQSNSATPSPSREKTLTKSSSATMSDPSPTKEQTVTRSPTGSQTPTLTPSISTTLSQVPSPTKETASQTSSVTPSEESTSTRSRSRSKGTATASRSTSGGTFSEDLTATRSPSQDPPTPTQSAGVIGSSTLVITPSASPGTATQSATGPQSETISDISGGHVRNGTATLSPTDSASASFSKGATGSRTPSKFSSSAEVSESRTLLATATPTPLVSPSKSIAITPTRGSQSASLSPTKQSASKQMTITTSTSISPSNSVTASAEFASYTKTKTIPNSQSPSQSGSVSTTSTQSDHSKSMSPTRQFDSKSDSDSPTYTVSDTTSLSPSQEPSPTLSRQVVETVTRSIVDVSFSNSDDVSATDTNTISRTVSRSSTAQASTSESFTETKEITVTPSPSSTPTRLSLTLGASASFQPDSSTYTLKGSRSHSAEPSLTLTPLQTDTFVLTVSPTPSSSLATSTSVTPTPDPPTFSESLSLTPTAEMPSITDSASDSQTPTRDASTSRTVTDTRTLIMTFTYTMSEELSVTRSPSPELSPTSTLRSTHTVQDSASATTVNTITLLTAPASASITRSYEVASKSDTMTLAKITLTEETSDTPSFSTSDSSQPTTTRSSSKGTKSLTDPKTASPSDSDSAPPSLTRSENMTFTVTKGKSRSRQPSGSTSRSFDDSRSVTVTGTWTISTSSSFSLTATNHRRRGGGSVTFTTTQSITVTVLPTPTALITKTLTETMSINASHTLSRNSPSEMESKTTTVSTTYSQEYRSKSESQSSSASLNTSATKFSPSSSPSESFAYTSTATDSDSNPPTATSTLVSTGTLTITPPPTPTPSWSDAPTLSQSSTTTHSASETQTLSLRETATMVSQSASETRERSKTISPTPSDTSLPSSSNTNTPTPDSMTDVLTLTFSASRDLSSSQTSARTMSVRIPPTRTKSLLGTDTVTLKLTFSVTQSSSLTQEPASSSETLNITDSMTMSSSAEVTSTGTLLATNSISMSPTQTLDYISPNSFFATSPFSSVYVYTAGRFLAIRFQGIPFNTTGDMVMITPVNSTCDSPPSGGYAVFAQSARQPAANALIRNNWTAFPKLSGEFSICYFTTSSRAWHKIVLPTKSIQLYAAVPATSVLRVINNTAVFSAFSIVLYGGNRSFDRPFMVRYGQSCIGGTKFNGALRDYNNNTFVATMDFFSIPTTGDYAVCYLGYPHLDAYALLLSGTRRIRITGGISSAIVGTSMIANFKVGRTVIYSIRGQGLSVRDAFFLTNASLTPGAPNPCSMPYNVNGAVHISWGQIQRVVPTDQTTSVYNLQQLSVSFLMAVPYNLTMCYRSNYSNTYVVAVAPLPYPVDAILPTWRAPNVSTIVSGSTSSSWSLGGSFLQQFSGEGVSGLYDEAFLVLNVSVTTNVTQATISTIAQSDNVSSTTFTAAAVLAAGAGCMDTSTALAVVKLTAATTSGSSGGVSYFSAVQIPALSLDVRAAILSTRVGIPATVCYKSNFSLPFNMGTVMVMSSFWNTSDTRTRRLFELGAPLGTVVSIAIGSDAVAPGNATNIFYSLFGISAQCTSIPPLTAMYPTARNQSHVSLSVPSRGIYQLCAVCGATGAVQNASFPVTPNNPNTLTPSMVGLLNATIVTVNGGVDFTTSTTLPDVLYACNTSLAGAVVITPLTSTTVLINASFLGNVTLCIRYGVQRNVTATVGTLTVSPFVHNVRTAPNDHRVGAVISIFVEGYGLSASDTLYPCFAAAAQLPIQFVSFSCANKTGGALNANLCTGVFNATATGSGSFPLCYTYAAPSAFPTGRLLNLSTGATVDLSFDALARSLSPSTIFASIPAHVNITGSGVAGGVIRVFMKTTPNTACEGDANPTDAVALVKYNTSKGLTAGSSTQPDSDLSWTQWTVTTSAARGRQALCYVSNSGASYTAGYITMKSVVSSFTSTQDYVTSTTRYASVPINVVVAGAAMLAANDTFFMVEQSTYTCGNGSGRAAMTVTAASLAITGLRTSIAFTVTVPVLGTYKVCYLRYGNESDRSNIASPVLAVSSSFSVTTTNITLVGPAPFLASLFRFSFATDIDDPIYVPYRTASSASSISVLYVPLGSSILYAELLGVNGLVIRVIQETIRFPVSSAALCTNFPQSLVQSDTKYQFAMSFIALYNFDASYCYSRIPTDYVLSPTNLINELLALTSSDVSLMVDARTTLAVVSRVALNTPQTSSRAATLLSTLLTSTADSLNIPDADITETLLLSHADLVNEIITSAVASVSGDAATTIDQSTVLLAVNRLNLVGAKYCASGLASSSTAVTIDEGYFGATVKNVAIGSTSIELTVPGPTNANASLSIMKGINVSSSILNPNVFVGCVMPTLTPKNFIPAASTIASSHRAFNALATTATSSTVNNFNVPLLSMALPSSTLSNPLGSLSTIVFSFAHPGIPNSNLTLGVGVDATFYRFSPSSAGSTTGTWIQDAAASATATNTTITVTYNMAQSSASSVTNPQTYFYLSGNYAVFAITPPIPVYETDYPLTIYVVALVVAHVIAVVVGCGVDRVVDRRPEKLSAPTTLPRRMAPPTAHVKLGDGSNGGGESLNVSSSIPSHSIAISIEPPASSSRGPPRVPKTRAKLNPPTAAISHEPDEGAHTEPLHDLHGPSNEPLDVAQRSAKNARSKALSLSPRMHTAQTLHRWLSPFLRLSRHPVGTAARCTTLATYWFAVSFFAYVVLHTEDYHHDAAANIIYGLMVAAMSTPFAVPSRVTLQYQFKDIPSVVSAILAMVAVVVAALQSQNVVGAIVSTGVGVVVTPLVWLIWFGRSSVDTQPRHSRIPVVVGLVLHGIVVIGTVAYLLYYALSHGTPIAWKRHYDYFVTVGIALLVDLIVLEPLKNYLVMMLAAHAIRRRRTHAELKITKKIAKETHDREAAQVAEQRRIEAAEKEAADRKAAEQVAESERLRELSRSRRREETDTEFERSEERLHRQIRANRGASFNRGHARPPTYLDKDGNSSFPYRVHDYDEPAARRSASVGEKYLDEYDDELLSARDGQFENYFDDDDDDDAPIEPVFPRSAQAARGKTPIVDAAHLADEDYHPLEEVDIVTSFASDGGGAFASFAPSEDDDGDNQRGGEKMSAPLPPKPPRRLISAGTAKPPLSAPKYRSRLYHGENDDELPDQAPAPANSRPMLHLDSESDSDKSHRRRRNTRLSVAQDSNRGDWEPVDADEADFDAPHHEQQPTRRRHSNANVDMEDDDFPFDPEDFDGVPFDGDERSDDADIVTDDGGLSEMEIDYLDRRQ